MTGLILGFPIPANSYLSILMGFRAVLSRSFSAYKFIRCNYKLDITPVTTGLTQLALLITGAKPQSRFLGETPKRSACLDHNGSTGKGRVTFDQKGLAETQRFVGASCYHTKKGRNCLKVAVFYLLASFAIWLHHGF